MLVKPNEFAHRLKNELPEVVWLSGDETLLVEEASAQVRTKAGKLGFSDREIIEIDKNFDWGSLYEASGSMSLFGGGKLLDIRVNNLKPGKAGAEKIRRWVTSLSGEVKIMLRSTRLDAATQKTAWFKALSAKGWVVQFWPLNKREFIGWIISRGKNNQIHIAPDAAEFLALQTEGNLLAAAQEVEKLTLLNEGKTIDMAAVMQAVHASYHFDVFEFTDSVLSGDLKRVIKIYRSLLNEGTAVNALIWPLARDLRELALMQSSNSSPVSHKPLAAVHPYVWKKRLPLFFAALKRRHNYGDFITGLVEIDKAGKGAADTDAVLMLEKLLAGICANPLK